jgi:hypothetical protein
MIPFFGAPEGRSIISSALILRSREAASRRMLQLVPEPPEASFETPFPRKWLLRMRAEGGMQ